MTAGARESLASAAPAPELYNPQARASGAEDDLVSDSIGTLRQAWRRPGAAAHGGGADASQHHLAFPARVQWFSACLVMLSLGAVELVVPNTLGAGLMAQLSTSAELLASALAMMLLLVPRLAGDRPGATHPIGAPQLAVADPGGDLARIPDVAPPITSTAVLAAPCDPGQAPLRSTSPQRTPETPLQIVDVPQIAHARAPGSSLPPGASEHLDNCVIPKLPPHVLALRELPAIAAKRAVQLLEAVITSRMAYVHRVLQSHAVPDELCDRYNLTCGLRGVTFVVEAEGDAAGRGVWRYELKHFNVSTKATRVEASCLTMLLSKVEAFSVLMSPEALVSAMAGTSIPASIETEPTAALEVTSTPPAALTPELAGMPVVLAVSLEATGMSSGLLLTTPVVVAVPWPAPTGTSLEHVQGAKAPPPPRPERLPCLLKAYLLCCTCASAARGAAAAMGVPPRADASWMADDELVNELIAWTRDQTRREREQETPWLHSTTKQTHPRTH